MNQAFSGNDRLFLDNLNRHLQNIPAPCPYGLPHQAIYRMARFKDIPEEIMGTLLAAGYRRYGNKVYTMGCETCHSCLPIRLNPFEFLPNRNQKRCEKKNRDITTETRELTPDKNDISLLQSFFAHRFPDNNNRATAYYDGFFLNSSKLSRSIRYYSEENLIGNSIIDLGLTWLNAVYFFFDPKSSHRSPGTFNIITLINLCKEKNIRNLYLGFWLKDSRAMNYKASFLPHYILRDNNWHKVS